APPARKAVDLAAADGAVVAGMDLGPESGRHVGALRGVEVLLRGPEGEHCRLSVGRRDCEGLLGGGERLPGRGPLALRVPELRLRVFELRARVLDALGLRAEPAELGLCAGLLLRLPERRPRLVGVLLPSGEVPRSGLRRRLSVPDRVL